MSDMAADSVDSVDSVEVKHLEFGCSMHLKSYSANVLLAITTILDNPVITECISCSKNYEVMSRPNSMKSLEQYQKCFGRITEM